MPRPDAPFDEVAWIQSQIERYGPVVGGDELRALIGFKSGAAFQKALSSGALQAPLYSIAGRRGYFALTEQLCRWYLAQRQPSANSSAGDAT